MGALLLAGCTGSSGSGETTTNTTSATMGTPTVSGSSLEVTDAGCGSTNASEASVSFEGNEAVVTGTVVGNNGCYRARLGEVSYDGSSDTCRVVVEAFDDRGSSGGCTECITEITYEAVVVFDGGLPGTLEVVHDELGGKNTVVSKDS